MDGIKLQNYIFQINKDNYFLSQFLLKLLWVDYGDWKQARGVIIKSMVRTHIAKHAVYNIY